MREFFRSISHSLEAGQPVELVSILASQGSTPRRMGAMMGVLPDGSSLGTIGGGNVEYEAQQLSKKLLETGGSDTRAYRFIQGGEASLGMVCGGDVTVHFQYLSPTDQPTLAVVRKLIDASGHNAGVWFARQLRGSQVTAMEAVSAGEGAFFERAALFKDTPVRTEDGWFSIPVERPGRVYLFGGGHVSQALVPVLAQVEFRVVVYDDRQEFANPALFPQAEQTLCGAFTRLKERLQITAHDYVVVMTRGHQADYEVLAQVLRSGARYLGCIGSRRKLALCRERLLDAGFTAQEYAAVHAPIGLSIGAQTPEEIAVSVAAEMIAVRAGVETRRDF